jgi:hypothetical protein
MTDEEKKRIISQPPPPTGEIDKEWGESPAVPEAVTESQPVPSGSAVSGTAAAPISAPAKSEPPSSVKRAAPAQPAEGERDDDDESSAQEADEEDDDEEDDDASGEEEDEEDDDEEDDDEEDDDEEASAEPTHHARAASDWIPDWGPYAVLGLLVSVSILVGLGLVGGPDAPPAEETTAAAPSAMPAASALKLKKFPAKPSAHP